MTPTTPATPAAVREGVSGPCRVVKRHGVGRIWDVYCEDIGDYLATMRPALPVEQLSVAQRICDSANAQWAENAAKATSK